jgi:predicted kinase
MEAVIFIGIQASGKTTFYKEYFFDSHIRVSLDLLNTKNKQNQFLETCFRTQSKFVIDNTNPEKETRKEFIEKAKLNKYKVIGYYFSSEIDEAIKRNSKREGKKQIPEIGIKGTYKKLELPEFEEGFDELFYTKLNQNGFQIEKWKNEI